MKLALIGTGRMGQAVEAVAVDAGHEIVARFDIRNPLLNATDPDDLNGAEMCVDFSLPEVALDHLHRYSFWGVDAVVGTTGWYDDISKVEEWVAEGQNGVLYAPNFSLGVAILIRALRGALPLLNHLPDYDAWVHEIHHAGKVDSPSGTAILLANEVIGGLQRKERIDPETQHGVIPPEALHVTSARSGHVFGEHTVGFDSAVDQLIFKHVAKSRRAFAFGAVKAAEWVRGRTGLFTLEDMLGDVVRSA